MKPPLAKLILGLVVSAVLRSASPDIPALPPQAIDPTLKSGTWVVIEFGGQNCVPCRKMQPVLAEVAKQLGSRGKVHNVWVTDHPQVARRFSIMLMPTQVLFDARGNEVLRHQGYWEQSAFLQALKEKGAL